MIARMIVVRWEKLFIRFSQTFLLRENINEWRKEKLKMHNRRPRCFQSDLLHKVKFVQNKNTITLRALNTLSAVFVYGAHRRESGFREALYVENVSLVLIPTLSKTFRKKTLGSDAKSFVTDLSFSLQTRQKLSF